MHDPVKYALWVGGTGLLVVLVCGAYLVWANAGSRNLALGLGALAGACVIFLVQIFFELKGTSLTTDFVSEYSIDYLTETVRSTASYLPASLSSPASLNNSLIEQYATQALAGITPPINRDDGPRIARDLTLVTIISVLLNEQPDWQLDSTVYRTLMGTMTTWVALSKPNECTTISLDEVRRQLKTAGNIFAGITNYGMRTSFCLPPHSRFQVSPNTVTLKGLVCTVTFTINEPFASASTMDPNELARSIATRTPAVAGGPTLPDGTPRYENVTITGRAKVSYSALHAQDRDLAKYQAWARRIEDSVKSRFSFRNQ